MSKVCAVCKGVSTCSAYRQSVCGFSQQYHHHVLYKYVVNLLWFTFGGIYMFGKDKDKQKKKKEKMNGKAGHSEENYNVLYDNLAFPEVYAIEQKQSDTEETDEEPVNYDNVAIPEINVKKDKN